MIKKFYGPPGTGKTEKLIRRALAYIRTGTQFQKIGYFALLKSCKRSKRKNVLKINLFKKRLALFSNLHS